MFLDMKDAMDRTTYIISIQKYSVFRGTQMTGKSTEEEEEMRFSRYHYINNISLLIRHNMPLWLYIVVLIINILLTFTCNVTLGCSETC